MLLTLMVAAGRGGRCDGAQRCAGVAKSSTCWRRVPWWWLQNDQDPSTKSTATSRCGAPRGVTGWITPALPSDANY